MKNDTAVSLLVASLVIALVCVPVMAVTVSFENKTYGIHIEKEAQVINGSYYVDISDIPSVHPGVTYPQEYYVLQLKANAANDHSAGGYDSAAAKAADSVFYELRRQTILMEKQNELLAEQNELMGRLVNATEIKFVVYPNPVYATQATSWNLDEPEVSPSFNTSNYEYTPNEADEISCDSLSHFQGCSS